MPKGEIITDPIDEAGTAEEGNLIDINEDSQPRRESLRRISTTDGGKIRPKQPTSESATGTSPAVSSMRRTSSAAGSENLPKRQHGYGPDMRQHLKHLGPSNLASRPRQTRYNTVKIKPGGATLTEGMAKLQGEVPSAQPTPSRPGAAVGAGVVKSAGKDANDGVLAVQAGYGGTDHTPPRTPRSAERSNNGVQATPETVKRRPSTDSAHSQSTVGSLPSRNGSKPPRQRNVARSGSITENIVDAGGYRKVVLEMTSSSEDIQDGAEGSGSGQTDGAEEGKENSKPEDTNDTAQGSKKKRRRKRKKGGPSGEDTPLLDREDS